MTKTISDSAWTFDDIEGWTLRRRKREQRMTIRSNLVKCIEAGGTPAEVARRICGMLSCECSLDNGNGWYDDDPEMANGGLSAAERYWLSRPGIDEDVETAVRELIARWDHEDGKGNK